LPPDIAPLTISVSSSSMLMPASASTCEMSWMMPGRSWPTSSSFSTRDSTGRGVASPLAMTTRSPSDSTSARVDLEANDAGELPGEVLHPALGPARAVGAAAVRQLADESGPVGADDGDDEGGEHGCVDLQ
jgi:hypothetical protein